jgi:hypothetical protein
MYGPDLPRVLTRPSGSRSNHAHTSLALLSSRRWSQVRRAPTCILRAITAVCRGVQGQVQAHPRPQGTRHHRRHLQFGLHAGVRHRADEQDLRDAEGSVGFHQAYYDKAFTFGIKVTSSEGTSDLMSYYPNTVKDWIRRNGGLTTEMKKIKNGGELWKIVDACPEEW